MADFYDCCNAESLTHKSEYEAVLAYLDGIEPELWPSQVEVRAYRRGFVSNYMKGICRDTVLENVLELLDEEYGNPEEGESVTQAMEEAATVFVDAMVSEYSVWVCEEVPEESIRVKTVDWVREYQKHWLEEEKVQRALEMLDTSSLRSRAELGGV
jgi:hypothetical protein